MLSKLKWSSLVPGFSFVSIVMPIVACIGVSAGETTAVESIQVAGLDVTLPERGSWSEQPAKKWQDAFVTGNGTLGAMVFGNPANERIVLNHERLYEPLLDTPCPVPDIASALPEVRRLMREGKYAEAYAHSYQAALDKGFPGIQWTDPYHPACALTIDQSANVDGHVSSIRTVDFRSGEVGVHWKSAGKFFERHTFVSRPDGVIVMRIVGGDGERVSGHIRLVNQDSRPKSKRTDQKGGGYHDPQIAADDEWCTYHCKYERSPRGYMVAARVVPVHGNCVADGTSIEFDAEELILLIGIESVEIDDGSDESMDQLQHRLSKIDADYNALLERHAAVHREMFDRVEFRLAESQSKEMSNEAIIELQKQTANESMQPALLEKMFDMGRYTLICSSGEWPPNLMGVWNGDWRPEWSGDFTLDANVNLQISGANLGALPEAIASYDRLVMGVVDDWRTNAKKLFGCRGILAGTRTDGRHNLHTHFSPTFPGHLWLSGAQWMLLPMVEHYETTGDEVYLKERLLPLMKEVALFYEDYLTERDEIGDRMFVPSYSPENHPGNSKSPAAINAAMDIACCKEVLTQLIAFKDIGELSDNEIQRYTSLLEEMPDYLINEDGALKEWAHPDLEDNYDHRHVSHLYPVWPGHEIDPDDTPELFAAATEAARRRGRGNGSAHGLAHMALIGARLKDADLVEGNLRFMLSRGYLSPSLFTYHNPGRIYNADMLHSLPAVVIEMLVHSKPATQSQNGVIELIPALKETPALAVGEIRGVRCRNQTTVESLNWDLPRSNLQLKLVSPVRQVLDIRVRRGIESVTTSEGKPVEVEGDGRFSVRLTPNQAVELSLRLR
ncbi:glycosyl hydrolase family 95 catalytic domain-containing protein [Aporhodopirellula aestuarii]|uniref:Glycoside hydrolase family 95 protein n=1 Tax=Aporhodopirellula aestuarii TaxID=2950107 RepID=A0ABT0U7J5_9BACT|nr:glycoside hydrolase N-terminal domain-containing protein [Aporhodopirellula aestuarii]MCM2372905.1 glycoside hydrolase family 95 protein [Aporhodopirellula aestuarii]